jgi:hypothetical protein
MAAKHRRVDVPWEVDDRKADAKKMCAVSGKRMYANERDANSTAAHRMNDKESAPSRLRTYKCIYCNAWHLTSKET